MVCRKKCFGISAVSGTGRSSRNQIHPISHLLLQQSRTCGDDACDRITRAKWESNKSTPQHEQSGVGSFFVHFNCYLQMVTTLKNGTLGFDLRNIQFSLFVGYPFEIFKRNTCGKSTCLEPFYMNLCDCKAGSHFCNDEILVVATNLGHGPKKKEKNLHKFAKTQTAVLYHFSSFQSLLTQFA